MLIYPIKEYYKPITYPDMATVESVNAGEPYYVASPTFGYEGVYVPVKGTVSCHSRVDEVTGIIDESSETNSIWVTCTTGVYQGDKSFRRYSLRDNGVIYQEYNDRLAFTNIFAALYYAETGRTK